MRANIEIVVDAPAATVWSVYEDVERWSEWTASIEWIHPLDGDGLEPGRRFAIKQPRLPKVVWEVTAVDRRIRWTWRQHSPGSTATAAHELVTLGPEQTLVRLAIEQRGLVGSLVGLLTRRLTARYLDMEARGVKARSEQRFVAGGG